MTPRLVTAGVALVGGLALTACEAPVAPASPAPVSAKSFDAPAVPPLAGRSSGRWVADGERARLTYLDALSRPAITLACGEGDLRVGVPGFRMIRSEDRLTVGAGDEAFALVADLGSTQPGVAAAGAVPSDLIDRIAGGQSITAIYGTQTLDSLPGPDAETSRAFVSACRAG